jgi:hypothetical protein
MNELLFVLEQAVRTATFLLAFAAWGMTLYYVIRYMAPPILAKKKIVWQDFGTPLMSILLISIIIMYGMPLFSYSLRASYQGSRDDLYGLAGDIADDLTNIRTGITGDSYQVSGQTQQALPAQQAPQSSQAQYINHLVSYDEHNNPAMIGHRYGLPPGAILAANGFTNNNQIVGGEIIVVPFSSSNNAGGGAPTVDLNNFDPATMPPPTPVVGQ